MTLRRVHCGTLDGAESQALFFSRYIKARGAVWSVAVLLIVVGET